MADRITAVIADDEPLARARIRALLRGERDIDVVGECETGSRTLERVRILRPALLFLDVQMPELDGFGVVRLLAERERPAAIVFVTAHDAYAVRAFDEAAVDYLVKPYSDMRFATALERARAALHTRDEARARIERLLAASVAPRIEPLACRTTDGVRLVDPREIDWIASDGNYTVLHVGPVSLRVRETLTDVCARLASAGFLRIHRTIAVNRDRIFRIEPWSSGEYLLVLRDGTKVQSSRSYGDAIRALMR